MRAILVGPTAARARLRSQLAGGSIDVVAEFDTAADARASAVAADAVISAAGPPRTTPPADPLAAEDGVVIEDPLTQREVQVLSHLAEGLPNKVIAARLGISDQTVKFHLAAIMSKLGTRNRLETVRRAVRRGLISL